MDHLIFADSKDPLIEVPYICLEEYDNEGFVEYPLRKGRELAVRTEHGATTWYSPREPFRGESLTAKDAPLLQTWLYFGLLSEVLGVSISSKEFIREKKPTARTICRTMESLSIDELAQPTAEPSQLIVSTALLPAYLKAWKARDSTLLESARKERLDHVTQCIQFASVSLHTIISVQRDLLAPEIIISIQTLGTTLELFGQIVFPELAESGRLVTNGFRHNTSIRSLMRDAGWCPTDISALARDVSVPTLYYACSRLEPRQKYHHAGCTDFNCLSNQVDVSSYTTAHLWEYCECHYLGDPSESPQDRLCSIIDSGGIPVVSLVKSGTGTKIELVEAGPQMQYVAISHVWAHGLGNPGANSLPQCQLLQFRCLLEAMSRSAPGPLHLWIDTLCVPLKPLEARKKAISQMERVYTGAQTVLVVDKGIQSLSKKIRAYDLVLSILTSSWMRRLWTYQEAAFANKLGFIVGDAYVGDVASFLMHELREKLPSTDEQFMCPVTADLLSCTWKLTNCSLRRKMESEDELMAFRIRQIFSNVQYRTSSKKSDETICIATMLGLDTLSLLNTPAAEREKTLVRMLKVFPAEIIFDSGGKFAEDGLRWAAKSFIDQERSISLLSLEPNNHNIGYIRPTGLEVQFPGFLLLVEKSPVNKFFFLADLADKNSIKFYRVDLNVSLGLPWKNYHNPRKFFGVILRDDTFSAATTCAFVDIPQLRFDVCPGRFLCTATITPLQGFDLLVAEGLFASEPRGEKDGVNFVVPGQRLDSPWSWCIG
jgi:hypothetical protein